MHAIIKRPVMFRNSQYYTVIATMKMKLLILFALVALGSCAHVDLQAKYPFSVVLLDDGEEYYGLHWNFTRSTESIYFAVNVSTTGWVGFGLSPNGQMPGSDVVIGWVDGENSYFHVSRLNLHGK